MLRVIAGKARRLNLIAPNGLEVRPTTDRIKETLFNMLSKDLMECNFLDLFSGSGAIGIEALSRGANLAVFVENNKEALACIRQNLAHVKLEHLGQVYPVDVITGLNKLAHLDTVFDVVFMDPPYNKELEKAVLEVLSQSNIINQDTMIIVEAGIKTDFSYLEGLGFALIKIKEYKTNIHAFISKKQEKQI